MIWIELNALQRTPDALRGALPERDGVAARSYEAVAPVDPPGALKKPFEGQASPIASAAASRSARTRCHA